MIAQAVSNLWIKNSSFPVLLLSFSLPFLLSFLSPSDQQASGWLPGRRFPQEGSEEPSWLQAWLQNEHIQVPEYTALRAYSLGWVCFGFFLFLSLWGHLGKQLSVWLCLTKISALLVWERAISIKLIKYTYYLSFVRKLPREM